jgi:hypothetical protein
MQDLILDTKSRRTEALIVSVDKLKTLKRKGSIAANFFYGSGRDGRNPHVYLLTSTGIYSLETGKKFQELTMIVYDWVLLSASVVRYPIDWAIIVGGKLVKL